MTIRSTLTKLTILTTLSAAFSSAAVAQEPQHPAFVNKTSQAYGLSPSYVQSIVNDINFQASIINSITHPAESKPWAWYQDKLVSQARIQQGAQYWRQHRRILKQAYQQYGVDPSIIVAIIGIETGYGKHKGSYRALDALGTLAFHYPKRATFFQRELGEYIALTHEQHLAPRQQHSSYAGALGIVQFMPSSYRQYAVHTKKHQYSDLFHNHNDAILSAAHYLKVHGWQKDAPVARLTSDTTATTPRHPQQWYQQHPHVVVNVHRHLKLPATVINLPSPDHKDYWLTFPNFNAILSYNHSNNYAMAVYQLGQAIKEQCQHDQQTTTS